MYIGVSDDFATEIEKSSRTFKARIKINGKWHQSIKSITITSGSCDEDNITIGSAVSSYIEIIMPDIGEVFENTEIELQEGILLTDGSVEYISMGYFIVQHPEEDNGYIKFTAYDRMAKLEKLYTSNLTYPATAIQVIDEICSQCGIVRETTGLGTVHVQAKPEGYTCREVIGYMASLFGKFAVIGRNGKLQIRWYEDCRYEVRTSRIFSFKKNQTDYKIGFITCNIDKNNQFTAGNGSRGITFDNPWITQERLEELYRELGGFTYRPATINFFGDIRIDVWDLITTTDLSGNVYKIPVMKMIQKFDGGVSTIIEAAGKTEEEVNTDYKGPITKGLERTYTELLLVNTIIATKVDAEWVKANTVTAEDITAVNAEIAIIKNNYLQTNEANIKYATIENLTAATGRIETLETNALTAGSALIHSLTSDVANINTLMFGTASGGSLTTEFSNTVVGLIGDAQIKSAMIKDISADKITSGKLYTNLVEVVSQSGNLNIFDNTIQIRDDAQTARVQIGKDAVGDYNIYIWDKNGKLMFDPLYGIQEDGIKSAVIRNDMVSENANISAKKLDISSLFTEINGSTETIKAGRIYVDSDNQTLDIAFKQMSTDVQTATTKADSVYSLAESANTNASSALAQVNTITETVCTQGTQLTALQGQISSKIWQQDIATAITEIEVGGRNLAENTNQGTKGWYWSMQVGGSTMEEVVEDGVKTCKFTRNSTAQQGWSYITYTNIGRNKWEADTEYTLSVDVKASVATEMYPRFVNASYNGSLIQSNQVINNKTVANKWVRLCWVVKSVSTLPTATDQGTYFNAFNSGIGVTYQFKNLKLEKGNKATDWTPAPEDTDSSIATLEGTTTTLSNQYTSLNQSLTSLTATVNNNTTAISTKADGSMVTTLQNNITELQADLTGFKSTVSESYATKTEFNNLKVGGRNIFLNTGKEFVNTGTNQTNQTKGFYALSTNKCNGKEVTVSFDWKVEGDDLSGSFNVQFSSSPWTTFSGIAISSANKSGHYVRTFTIPTNGVMGTMVRMDNFVGTLTISNAKLEEGNKATDWTPAPEDIDTKFADYSTTTQMNSAIEQKSSSILQTVSATYATQSSLDNYATTQSVTASLALKIDKTDNNQIVSMVNASADVISLKADRFQLSSTYTTITKDGKITCNSLTANSATINGVLTAGAGSRIADFSVKSDILYRDQGNYGVGLSAPNNASIAIWAGTNSSHIGEAPFKVYYDGSAYIGGWNMNDTAIYYDHGNYRTYIQHPTSAESWVFSTQNKVSENEYEGSCFIKQSGFLHATEIEVENSLTVNGPIYAVNDAGGKRLCVTSNNAIVHYWQPDNWNLDVYIDGTYVGILPLLPINTINPSGKPVISNTENQLYVEWNGSQVLMWVDDTLVCSFSENGLEWHL